MNSIDSFEISEALRNELDAFFEKVRDFRKAGPLDPVAVAKLEEHFKASHVYHSAGIEGNRLTLQETLVVLKEGIDITGKSIKDTIEVQNLGHAFDFLKVLAESNQTLRETDIRDLHKLVVGADKNSKPGEYRSTGVIISGAEHRPPEPLEVAQLMDELVRWINQHQDLNPLVLATIAHHRLTAIHPFLDGNGRVSRLVMNLLLLRAGLPISNIAREDRPKYYEALSFADVGYFEDITNLVYRRAADLFSEYVRLREESERMADWAKKWGSKEAGIILRRESREHQLWQSRIRQVFLEFQKTSELLNDELEAIEVNFFDYNNEVTLEKYAKLQKEGSVEQSNAFAINFIELKNKRRERFALRYCRDWKKFPRNSKLIPLELVYLDPSETKYIRLGDSKIRDMVRLRDLYFTEDGKFKAQYWNIGGQTEVEEEDKTIQQWVQYFFDDVLKHVFGLSESGL